MTRDTKDAKNVLSNNANFAWPAVGTLVILLVSALATKFTDEVKWDLVDFFVMGSLTFGSGCLFVFISRRASPKGRMVIAVCIAVTFLLIWAELAVGIFSNQGS